MDTSYEGEKAVLSSPELYSEEWSCVRLIYQIAMTSEASPDPARLNLYLRQEGESFDRLLWSANEPSDSWLIASLDLMNSTKKYKVSLVLENTTGCLVHVLGCTNCFSNISTLGPVLGFHFYCWRHVSQLTPLSLKSASRAGVSEAVDAIPVSVWRISWEITAS